MQLSRLPSPYIFIAAILLACSCSHHQPLLLTRKYPPGELKRDAELLRDVTLAMHPVIGIYKPRAYYTALFNNFIDGIRDSLTEKQFRIRLKLLTDELHCGHTEVLPSKGFYKEVNRLRLNYSPYLFLPVNDRVYVAANLNKKADSTLRKGMEITRINGIAVDSMLNYSRRFVSSDGYNQTAKRYYIQLGFNAYYQSLFGRPDSFEVEYKTRGVVNKLRYKTIRLKNLPPLPLEKKDSSYTRLKRAGIRYKYLDPEKKTLHLKIEKFSHAGATKAYRRTFRRLKRNKSENLVLDVRGNGGGSLANTYVLLSYLMDTSQTQTLKTGIRNYPYRKYTRGNVWFKLTRAIYTFIGRKTTVNDTDYFVYTIKPRKKNHFNGRVFVLTDGGSFSASCLVAAYLKKRRNTTFIGEETGGASEGCNAGVMPYYRLPVTGLRVRMPAFRVLNDVMPETTGRGVMPDIVIEPSKEDLFKHKDAVLIKVRELAGLKQQQ